MTGQYSAGQRSFDTASRPFAGDFVVDANTITQLLPGFGSAATYLTFKLTRVARSLDFTTTRGRRYIAGRENYQTF